MKASIQSGLFALTAASLSAAMIAPVSAQKFVPRGDQTCANRSTARDLTQRTDSRCLQGGGKKETYQDQQGSKAAQFLVENPGKATVIPNKDGSNRIILSGTNGSGVPYRIIMSGGKTVGYGSAAGINPKKGGGGKGQR